MDVALAHHFGHLRYLNVVADDVPLCDVLAEVAVLGPESLVVLLGPPKQVGVSERRTIGGHDVL